VKLLGGARDQGLQKSFSDVLTVYLMDDTPKTIVKAFASPDVDDWK
jgi:hypothetical protein